jgi:hypothetical protein
LDLEEIRAITLPVISPSPLCFSGNTKVHVLGRKNPVFMSDLQIGDYVWAGEAFSRVYSFGHYDSTSQTEYLQIYTTSMTDNLEDNEPLEMTSNHMIFVSRATDDAGGTYHQAIPVSQLEVGDEIVMMMMSTDEGPAITTGNDRTTGRVSRLAERTVTRKGAYAPFTDTGTIVVNGGILASCYISLLSQDKYMQWLAHYFTAPRRLYCTFMWSQCLNEQYTPDGLASWVAIPFHIVTATSLWWSDQPTGQHQARPLLSK